MQITDEKWRISKTVKVKSCAWLVVTADHQKEVIIFIWLIVIAYSAIFDDILKVNYLLHAFSVAILSYSCNVQQTAISVVHAVLRKRLKY